MSVLENYSVPEKVRDAAERLIRNYCQIAYEGRSSSLSRFKVVLKVLKDLSTLSPQLRPAWSWYLENGPLQLGSYGKLTK
jgi:hypothetical protein